MTAPHTNSKSEMILSTILQLLTAKDARPGLAGGLNASTRLVEAGLIDSTQLLDLVLEVEQRCAAEFDPTRIDFEGALTIGSLVSAFTIGADAVSAAAR
jgi:acyl carrier protein